MSVSWTTVEELSHPPASREIMLIVLWEESYQGTRLLQYCICIDNRFILTAPTRDGVNWMFSSRK